MSEDLEFSNFYIHGHTSISYLKKQNAYYAAKQGSLAAAKEVVSSCIKPQRVAFFRQKYSGCVLLPVISKNMLPLALAIALDMPVSESVYLCPYTDKRKHMNAMQRMLNRPMYFGRVKKEHYILIDDVITTGGAINSLRQFVIHSGGETGGAAVLASAAGSLTLYPDRQKVVSLYNKFGASLPYVLDFLRFPPNPFYMTNAQACYLLRFSSATQILCRAKQYPPFLKALSKPLFNLFEA